MKNMLVGLVVLGMKVNILWTLEKMLMNFHSNMYISSLSMYIYARNQLRLTSTLGLHTLYVQVQLGKHMLEFNFHVILIEVEINSMMICNCLLVQNIIIYAWYDTHTQGKYGLHSRKYGKYSLHPLGHGAPCGLSCCIFRVNSTMLPTFVVSIL